MDNRLFNVNGSSEEMLLKTLELAFMQAGFTPRACAGWQQTKENGLILCWSNKADDINAFPTDLNAEECFPFVKQWLKSANSKNVEFGDWCGDCDHDGHNSLGWQVYCEPWGHVGTQHYSICAVRRAYMWHGK